MNPLNQTEEKREAVPNGVSRVGIAALGVLLQVLPFQIKEHAD